MIFCLAMELPRRKQRELLLQLLFSWEVAGGYTPDIFMETVEVSKKHVLALEEEVQKIIEKGAELDQTIARASKDYALDRISCVDHLILRLSLFSFLFAKEDVKIVIDEAIRLSRKFSTPEAASYVHAVIDEVCKSV